MGQPMIGRGRAAAAAGLALGVAALGLGALTGCGHSPPTQFYTLDPAPSAAAPLSGPIAPVRVQAVHLPAEFDRPQIVTRSARAQLQVHEFRQWAGPVGTLARSALTLDLAARLPTGSVLAPDAPRTDAARLLTVDILDLRIGPAGTQMTAVWTLSSPPPVKGSAPIPASVSRTEQLSAPAGGADGADEAQVLDGLLGQLADRIAPELHG